MSNGKICCALGVCCDGPAQKAAIEKALVHDVGCTEKEAGAVAEWIVTSFDLAPPGSLKDLKDAIATMARKHEGV